MANGIRASTAKTYSSAQSQFQSFCTSYGLQALPASNDTVLWFVAYLHKNGLAASSMSVYISAIRALHVMNGYPEPGFRTPQLKLALKAASESGTTPSRKAPLTFKLLKRLCSLFSQGRESVWPALFTLGFFGSMRGSEYTSMGRNLVLVNQVKLCDTKIGPALAYTVGRSKTSQAGFTVRVGCSDTSVCSPCLLIKYLQYREASGSLSGQHCLFVDELGRPVSKHMLDRKIKWAVSQLGLDPHLYSSHSLRSGAATSASEAGFSEWEIRQLGRWASSAYLTYVRQSHLRQWQYAARLAQSTR